VKINTDGSFFSNDKRAGIGGIVRHDNGNIIIAFSIPVQCNGNNHAEILAVDYGIKWCINHGYNNLQIELDSLVIANMLRNKSTNNMKIKHIADRITNFLIGTNHHFSHCFREANQVADFLAKNASSSGNSIFYHSFQELPRAAKGLFKLDKCNSLRLEEDLTNVIFLLANYLLYFRKGTCIGYFLSFRLFDQSLLLVRGKVHVPL